MVGAFMCSSPQLHTPTMALDMLASPSLPSFSTSIPTTSYRSALHRLSFPKSAFHTPSCPSLSIHRLHSSPRAAVFEDLQVNPPPTFYQLLGVSQNDGLSDIKQAYRQMARKYHPDVCPANRTEESTRRFIEIQEAYETLSDPRSRALYDHAIVSCLSSVPSGRRSWGLGDQKMDWKFQWENQLNNLKSRSSLKSGNAESWAARIRRQRQQMSETS